MNKLMHYGLSMLISKGRKKDDVRVTLLSVDSNGRDVNTQASFSVKPHLSPRVSAVFGTEAGTVKWTNAELNMIQTKAQDVAVQQASSDTGLIKFDAIEKEVVRYIEAEIVAPSVVAGFNEIATSVNQLAGDIATALIVSAGGNTDPIVIPPPPHEEEGTTVTLYNAGISPQFLTPTGNLLAGTGIPGNNSYKVVSNNVIELAMAAHARNNWTRHSVNNSAYTLSMSGALIQWNTSWSVGYVGEEEGTLITDVYDVEFFYHINGDGSVNEATALKFRMEHNGTRYVLINDSDIVINDVLDSAIGPNNSCGQNSFSLTWLSTQLNPPIAAGTIVVGTYVIEMRATHKITGNVVSNVIQVTANNTN